jgi:hypothetical protein
MPTYLLLLKELNDEAGVRKQRIESRRETYDRLIEEIRAGFTSVREPDPTIDKMDRDFARINVHMSDASGAKDGTVTLPPRLPPQAEAAD